MQKCIIQKVLMHVYFRETITTIKMMNISLPKLFLCPLIIAAQPMKKP